MLSRRLPAAVAVAASLLAAAPAAAQSPPQPFAPYDGAIPFNCELQNVGTGTAFPHPEADPFCVEFDKTNQNVSDFGIADFTAQEPARVAAASSKCFYFQRDHWTGSVVQGSGPETWHWDGDYWYDRARGVGGVSVRNFRIGGQAQDPSPYAPEAYRPYFGEGGGGAMVNMATAPSPDCIDKVDTPEERDRVYAGRGLYPDCIDPGGRLHGKHVGEVKLGMSRDKARQKLGPPGDHAHGIDYWCLIGKGELRVAYVEGKAAAVLTSGRGHSVHGVSRGDHAQRAHRRLHLIDGRRAAGYHLFTIGGSLDPLDTIALEAGRVRWVMIADIKPLVGHALPKQLIRDVP